MVGILRIAVLGWLLLLCVTTTAQVQNLVPNPGFEIYTQCPFDNGQVYFAAPWKNATHDLSAFCHACSTHPGYGVPGGSAFAYQIPRSGDGYTLIRVYGNAWQNAIEPIGPGNGEYIATPLIRPMEQGRSYYIEFFTLPFIYSAPNSQGIGYTDAVGMALTDTFFYKEIVRADALPLTPVIENRGVLIVDTVNWTRVSGCYTAKGGERYATIGNFRNAAETMVVFEGVPSSPFVRFNYIDDVFIGEFNPLPDTLLLCEGEELHFNAGFLDARYRWSTGAADSMLTVQAPGVYTIEATMEKCVLRDTVVVVLADPNAHFPQDTAICRGEPITLSAPMPGRYEWSNGATGAAISVSAPGQYSLRVTNNCGVYDYRTDVMWEDCDCRVYVPTAFSPNDDGINDALEVFPYCDWPFEIHSLKVFDRWGSLVYASEGQAETGWDGSVRGQAAATGTYVWVLEYSVERNGVMRTLVEKGETNLMR